MQLPTEPIVAGLTRAILAALDRVSKSGVISSGSVVIVKELTFKEVVCRRHGIAPADFVEFTFDFCLFPYARPAVRVLRALRPSFFASDLKMIESVADISDRKLVQKTLDRHRENFPVRGLLRRHLQLRVSGKKVLRLATKLLP